MEDSEYVGKGVSKDFQEKSQQAVHTFLSSHPCPDLNITPDKVKEITYLILRISYPWLKYVGAGSLP